MAAIDISVCIVSYNTCELLRACLQSLQDRQAEKEVTMEVIVVDNGSHDSSTEMVKSEFPKVLLLETGQNLGYGKANNLGLKQAKGRHYFVLNSDTEVLPGALRALVDFLDKTPKAGAVTAQLVLPNGDVQSMPTDPTLLKVFSEQTYIDKLPQNKFLDDFTKTHRGVDCLREIEQVAGAAFAIRAQAWQEVQGFDEAFFMYFEDTDLCIRLRRAGWEVWYLPQAKVRHKVGASSERDWQVRALMISSYNWSRYYFFSTRKSTFEGKMIKVFVVMGAFLRLFAWMGISTVKPQKRSQVRLFREVLRKSWRMKVGDRN